MDILIKGMEMPTSCSVCRLFGEYGCPFIGAVSYAMTRGSRNEDCPLVPVPPHGPLIDVKDEFEIIVRMMPGGGECHVDISAPTVIPASEEGE